MLNNTRAQASLPPVQAYECCCGHGQFHTNDFDESKPDKKLTPYDTITLEEIRQMVDNPQSVDKSQGQWIIPSSLKSRNFREQETRGEFVILWLDLDKNTLPILLLHKNINRVLGGKYQLEIYFTASATKNLQKSRVLIPLEFPLNGKEWKLCQEILNDHMEESDIIPDRATERTGQLCYLPNRGQFYDKISDRESQLFSPIQAFEQEIKEKKKAIARAKAESQARRDESAKRKANLQYTGQSADNLISTFNETHTIEDILIHCGYDQSGDRFRHPNSQSGSYSASVKNSRLHSLSSSDPLYTGGGNQGAHDSFSAFTVLFHSGDVTEALKDAGDNWLSIGVESWNIVRQREQNVIQQSNSPIQPAQSALKTLQTLSTTRRIDEMEKNLKKDTYIIEGMALDGQITVFYAAPNTGKTLFFMRFIIDAIRSRRIRACDIFYLNADDHYKGLLIKSRIAKDFGFEMISPSEAGIEPAEIVKLLNDISKTDEANGKIIIIDTLKKFTDMMSKKAQSSLFSVLRKLIAKNATVIIAGHTNKYPDKDENLIYEGTSDIKSDIDCMYSIYLISETDKEKVVEFRNEKNRGNVTPKVSYQYSKNPSMNYMDMVNSICKLNSEEVGNVKQQSNTQRLRKMYESERLFITRLLKDGSLNQSEIMDKYKSGEDEITAEFSTRTLGKALVELTGIEWTSSRGAQNAKIFSLTNNTAKAYLQAKNGE